MITHCDIINYLSQLNFLKFADHSVSIEKGGLDVHTEVCANMRAKLSSEIVANRQKMKASFRKKKVIGSMLKEKQNQETFNKQRYGFIAHSRQESTLPNRVKDRTL